MTNVELNRELRKPQSSTPYIIGKYL